MSKLSPLSFGFSVFGNRFYFTPKFIMPTAILILLLVILGSWQFSKANSLEDTVNLINSRLVLAPIQLTALQDDTKDWRFYPIVLRGVFDNVHQILRGDRAYQGQLGYDVLTPFKSTSTDAPYSILVNRGWIPLGDPTKLPNVEPVTEEVTLHGFLIVPSSNFYQKDFDPNNVQWPLLIWHTKTDHLSKALGYPLYPYVVLLSSSSPNGFVREWQRYTSLISPVQNQRNAEELFGLALASLIIFIILNMQRG